MTGKTVTVRIDESSAAWIAEFSQRLSVLGNLVQNPVDLIERVRSLPKSGRFHVKRLATLRANEVRISIEPSEALLDLMSAMRTIDGRSQLVV